MKAMPDPCKIAIARALLLAILAVPVQLTGQIKLPDIGDSSQSVFSSSLEREVGDAFMRQVRASATLVDDPEVADYVQSLGYSLTSTGGGASTGFNFFVVHEDAVNAFAAPGGWVGVNTGLILASESESELAAVLAHEIAHVTQRHIARSIELSERSNIAALAGLLAAVAIGIANPEAGSAAAATVLGSQAQQQLNFSRTNEQEADRVGIQMLLDAGFDPSAMAGFFEKLQTASRYYRRPPEFLSTHPVTTSRIADAQGRARQFGVRQHSDSVIYRMVRAKLRLAAERDNDTLEAWFLGEIERSAPARSPGLQYGLALTRARAERYEEALEGLRDLHRQHQDIISLRIALAEVLVKAKRHDEALAIYRDTHSLMPDSRLVTQSYAEALLLMNEPQQVLKILADHQRFATLTSPMYRIEADAYARLGREVDSQVALAEHYYLSGNLTGAIAQLKRASAHRDNDFYKASRIEARIEELEREHTELNARR